MTVHDLFACPDAVMWQSATAFRNATALARYHRLVFMLVFQCSATLHVQASERGHYKDKRRRPRQTAARSLRRRHINRATTPTASLLSEATHTRMPPSVVSCMHTKHARTPQLLRRAPYWEFSCCVLQCGDSSLLAPRQHMEAENDRSCIRH